MNFPTLFIGMKPFVRDQLYCSKFHPFFCKACQSDFTLPDGRHEVLRVVVSILIAKAGDAFMQQVTHTMMVY